MDRGLDQAKSHRMHHVVPGVAGRMNEATRPVRQSSRFVICLGPRGHSARLPRHHTAPGTEPTRCRAVPAGRMQWETRPMPGNA